MRPHPPPKARGSALRAEEVAHLNQDQQYIEREGQIISHENNYPCSDDDKEDLHVGTHTDAAAESFQGVGCLREFDEMLERIMKQHEIRINSSMDAMCDRLRAEFLY